MRNLYLIRHGKPQYPDEHSYCIGQTDFSLSMLGHLQSVLLHGELDDKITAVYCSPLSRDLTAEQMGDWAAAMGIEAVYIDGDTTIRNLQNELRWNSMYFSK